MSGLVNKEFFEGSCYRLTGDDDKPTVVLLHGVGLNQDMWLPWIEILSDRYRVLTYDFLGHGGSHNPPGERTVEDYVEQLRSLVDYLGLDRFALAGFSMGALISQAFASSCVQRGEDRLAALGLLHSVYQRRDEHCIGVQERYRITREQGPMATVEMAVERWFSEEYRKARPDQIDEIRTIFANHRDDGYLKAYYVFAFGEPQMKNYPVTGVNCPALIVTGGDDVGSLPAMSEALAGDIADARLIINPGHRHGAPYEHAELMANQIKDFLLYNEF